MADGVHASSPGEFPRREGKQTPDEVAAMLRLKSLGWGIRRIAKELGCSHMTVRRYVAEGGWVAYRGRGRPRALAGHEEWLEPLRLCRRPFSLSHAAMAWVSA